MSVVVVTAFPSRAPCRGDRGLRGGDRPAAATPASCARARQS